MIKAGDKIDQRYLAGISFKRKHAFAKKYPTNMDAIEASRQLIVFPDFDRMAIALFKKLAVKRANGRINPRTDTPGPGGTTALNHSVKIAIDSHFKSFS